MELVPTKPTPANISDIMENAYIDYSMSVIIARALPDARDGLKPVQRRILYAMLREGLLHNRPFDKCAGVVGEVLKNYHPHGDSSVYDTLVRLAQNWVMRYPLISPQGNFGSVDGDPPAAYRYTECRLSELAEDLTRDLDEGTVDFIANYKESTTEPTVLPAALPCLLINGSTGIAVGMATNIPPHNAGEIIDAACAIIDRPGISLDEIAAIVRGPDFPTGGTIAGRDAILSYLKTGKGIVRIRGKAQVEEFKKDAEQIIITEIPYNVNRARLVEHIARLITEKEIDGIRDVRDESDENTRIVIELKRGEQAQVVLNQLYLKTELESSFGVTLLALDKKRPKQMNIRELLDCYLEHRRDVVTRRTRARLAQAEARTHVLDGYLVAQDNIDDVIRVVRAVPAREDARAELMRKYPLSVTQADAILELRIYQLTGLERGRIQAERAELAKTVSDLRLILDDDHALMALIRSELATVRARYADPRKTEITNVAAEDISVEDVTADASCIITVSRQGFIKRTAATEYRSQKRGGKGVLGADTYAEDFTERLFTATTHSYILFITDSGQCLAKKVYDIPEGARTAKGKSVRSFLSLKEGERITAMVCVREFSESLFLVVATRTGMIKKSPLSDYANSTRDGGLIGINLAEGDSVIGAVVTTGSNELMLVSRQGLAVRFLERSADTGEELFRATGRATGGVTGMRFKLEGDALEVLEVVNHDARLLIASEAGLGVRTRFEDYRLVNRGASGVCAMDLPSDNSVKLVGAISVMDTDEVMLLTAKGQSVRFPVKDIRETSRGAKGVKLTTLAAGDKLLTIARVVDAPATS